MCKPHKHAAIIKAWADGAEIQTREPGSDKDWSDTRSPIWTNYMDYRVKPEKKPDRIELVSEAPKPHKWAKELHAMAEGCLIEGRMGKGRDWHPVNSIFDVDPWEYRIKPEPKPDSHSYGFALAGNPVVVARAERHRHERDNVKFTFDGETGKLKAVELIK